MLQSSTAITVAGVVRGRRNPLHLGLPERLKKTRKAVQLTRQGLSLRAGLSNTAVRLIEEEGRIPAIDTIELLARALAVEPCWLAFGVLGGRTFGSGRFPTAEQPPDDPQPAPAHAPAGPLTCEGVGGRLALARGEAGLSMGALSRSADLARGTISYIEAGKTQPSVATAEQLAGALGVSPCWLCYGVGEGPGEGEEAPAPAPVRRPRKPAAPRRARKPASTSRRRPAGRSSARSAAPSSRSGSSSRARAPRAK